MAWKIILIIIAITLKIIYKELSQKNPQIIVIILKFHQQYHHCQSFAVCLQQDDGVENGTIWPQSQSYQTHQIAIFIVGNIIIVSNIVTTISSIS